MSEVREEVRADEHLDLKGEICPYTFVKSKLALELMESGQILRVIVDNEESVDNVPKSCRNEGHNILGVEKISPHEWAITIQKK